MLSKNDKGRINITLRPIKELNKKHLTEAYTEFLFYEEPFYFVGGVSDMDYEVCLHGQYTSLSKKELTKMFSHFAILTPP